MVDVNEFFELRVETSDLRRYRFGRSRYAAGNIAFVEVDGSEQIACPQLCLRVCVGFLFNLGFQDLDGGRRVVTD